MREYNTALTYEENLLEDLKEGPVRFYGRNVVGRRLPLLRKLEKDGLITMSLKEVDEQESYLLVERI